MKKLIFVLLFIFIHVFVTAQITVKHIGKVYYYTISSNKVISQRNDTIAMSVNSYIQRYAKKDFPDVLLYINDQDPKNKLSNFEQVLVYYQKYKGEFFNKFDDIYSYPNAHIGIELSLFRNHYQKGMEAIKYVVSNLKKLKKEEKRLSRKNKRGVLEEEDLKCFEL
ncbi:hypothetical protein [Chitinophaga silvatica]|nr:hypothetical protein [Chitinophaga silvatica]